MERRTSNCGLAGLAIREKSARRLRRSTMAHSRTLPRVRARKNFRQVLECASPLALCAARNGQKTKHSTCLHADASAFAQTLWLGRQSTFNPERNEHPFTPWYALIHRNTASIFFMSANHRATAGQRVNAVPATDSTDGIAGSAKSVLLHLWLNRFSLRLGVLALKLPSSSHSQVVDFPHLEADLSVHPTLQVADLPRVGDLTPSIFRNFAVYFSRKNMVFRSLRKNRVVLNLK